jgi:hypothetical protein
MALCECQLQGPGGGADYPFREQGCDGIRSMGEANVRKFHELGF